jgi:hypothetical protein
LDFVQEGEETRTAEDDAFIDDSEAGPSQDWEAELQGYTPGKCNNVIFVDENGVETMCGNPTNPAEQLCHDCRCFGHRLTGLL